MRLGCSELRSFKKKLLWEFKGEESSRGEAEEVSQKKVGTGRGKLERTKWGKQRRGALFSFPPLFVAELFGV